MGLVLSAPKSNLASHFGGTGSLSGTVTSDTGATAVREIRVFDEFSGMLLRKTESAADGTYFVADLKVGLSVSVIFRDDPAGTAYNDIIKSRVIVA